MRESRRRREAKAKKKKGENIENLVEEIELDGDALFKRYGDLKRNVVKVCDGIDAGGILRGKCDVCKEF